MIYSGGVSLHEAEATYFKAKPLLDILFTLAFASVNFIGTIYLFMLRQTSFYLFLSGFVIGILMTVYQIFFQNWLATIGGPGLIGVIIGWTINIAILIYVRNLIKYNVLN